MKNKNRKKGFILITVVTFMFLSGGITIEVTSAEDLPELQSGDLSLTITSYLDNVTIWPALEGSQRFSIHELKPLFNYKTLVVTSGSSSKAIKTTFDQISLKTGETSSESVIYLFPFSSKGKAKLAQLGYSNALTYFNLKNLHENEEYYRNKILQDDQTNTTTTVIQTNSTTIQVTTSTVPVTTVPVNDYVIADESLFNIFDFQAAGKEELFEDRYKTADILTAGEKLFYDNISLNGFSDPLDTQFYLYAQQTGLINIQEELSTHVMRTEDLIGKTAENEKYYTFLAGFDKFEQNSIIDPILEFAIDELYRTNGIVYQKKQLLVQYDTFINATSSIFFSDNLKKYITSPLNQDDRDYDSPFESKKNYLRQVKTIGFLGFNILTLNINSLIENVGTPLLRLDSFVATKTAPTQVFTAGSKASIDELIYQVDKVTDRTSNALLTTLGSSSETKIVNNIPRIGSTYSSGATQFLALEDTAFLNKYVPTTKASSPSRLPAESSSSLAGVRYVEQAPKGTQAIKGTATEIVTVAKEPFNIMNFLPVFIGAGLIGLVIILIVFKPLGILKR